MMADLAEEVYEKVKAEELSKGSDPRVAEARAKAARARAKKGAADPTIPLPEVRAEPAAQLAASETQSSPANAGAGDDGGLQPAASQTANAPVAAQVGAQAEGSTAVSTISAPRMAERTGVRPEDKAATARMMEAAQRVSGSVEKLGAGSDVVRAHRAQYTAMSLSFCSLLCIITGVLIAIRAESMTREIMFWLFALGVSAVTLVGAAGLVGGFADRSSFGPPVKSLWLLVVGVAATLLATGLAVSNIFFLGFGLVLLAVSAAGWVAMSRLGAGARS